MGNPIVDAYSRLAERYDEEVNLQSCWGKASSRAMASLKISARHRKVLDVGCGTGRTLMALAQQHPETDFVGVEPAENMRRRAAERCETFLNIQILNGSFESIPLDSATVDYLCSVFAFHWTTDLNRSVRELARVLKPQGDMDLFFIGRNNGREFIQRTTPIFLKYLGPTQLLKTAQLRKQLTREAAFELFSQAFSPLRLSVEESYNTFYDTLEGHWGWWVRIEGHFVQLDPTKKQECDQEVKEAIQSLSSERGIPYTIHEIHVSVRAS